MEERWAIPTEEAAVEWCKRRNEMGIRCLLDPLGRYSRTEEQISSAMQEHFELIEHIASSKIDAALSIKLTTIGGTVDRERCIENAMEISRKAAELGVGFEVDMEGQRMVNLTLQTVEQCLPIGPVTIALQAYLDRTRQDLTRMLDAGARVRLVKGAYSGNISDFEMIQEVFKDLAEEIVDRNVPFSIATHDPDLIHWAVRRVRDKELLEFGFLKGLADDTKRRLVRDGWNVVEYVPYGSNKEGYEARRRTYLKHLDELGRTPVP